jgi:hypothetical protein
VKRFGKAVGYTAVIMFFLAATAWRFQGDDADFTSTRRVVTFVVLVLLVGCLLFVTNGFRGRGRGPTR